MDNLTTQPFHLFSMTSPAVTESCIQLSTLHQGGGWMDLMEVVASVIEKTRSEDMETVLFGKIIYKTITSLRGIPISNTEDTFVHNCMYNLLSSIFSCNQYFIQEWENKGLESSQTYQPDLCASVKLWKKKYDIIVAEATPIITIRKVNIPNIGIYSTILILQFVIQISRSNCKPKGKQNMGIVSDTVKLGRELNSMLEKLIKSGVENPEVFGLLVKGGVLEMYVIYLKGDGIYKMMEIELVNLVTNFTEIIHFTRTLPLLYNFKEQALTIVKRLEISELQKAKGVTLSPSLPVTWFRKSMNPKMKILN